MEKVVLTESQAAAVEMLHEKSREEDVMLHVTSKWTHQKYLPLNGLELDEFIRALYVGYVVVQPDFKAGDKILVWGKIVTLKQSKQILGVEAWSIEETSGANFYASDFTKATPEEIYWLETLGREKVGDFRIGDIILNTILMPYVVRNETDGLTRVSKSTALKMYEDKEVFSIYPADSEKQLPQEEK